MPGTKNTSVNKTLAISSRSSQQCWRIQEVKQQLQYTKVSAKMGKFRELWKHKAGWRKEVRENFLGRVTPAEF